MIDEFTCPECGGANRVEWGKDETRRAIACIHCASTVFDEEPQHDANGQVIYSKGRRYDDGSPVPVTVGVARQIGCRFVVERREVIGG